MCFCDEGNVSPLVLMLEIELLHSLGNNIGIAEEDSLRITGIWIHEVGERQVWTEEWRKCADKERICYGFEVKKESAEDECHTSRTLDTPREPHSAYARTIGTSCSLRVSLFDRDFSVKNDSNFKNIFVEGYRFRMDRKL